jgi:hypothetical protein
MKATALSGVLLGHEVLTPLLADYTTKKQQQSASALVNLDN